jgi:glutathione S-transferase
MITLYTFGPYFDLPDASPFVVKAMMLLKLAGVAYREDRTGYLKAPKGKLPYIEDADARIADSTFIRFHIEQTYGFDFDAGLTPAQKATAWVLEKMCEDHLYFIALDLRWCDDENFARGPAHLFDAVPAPIRPLVRAVIRRKMRKTLALQGLGRHGKSEILQIATRDFAALATLLGDKPYVMGEHPCGADATFFAFVIGVLAPIFSSPVREAAESHPNLVAYAARLRALHFPAASAV